MACCSRDTGLSLKEWWLTQYSGNNTGKPDKQEDKREQILMTYSHKHAYSING
jgi:hypothetical protein